MRVVFIGRSHSYSLLPLKALQRRHEVVGYVESESRGRLSKLTRIKTFASQVKSDVIGRPSIRSEARKAKMSYMKLSRETITELPAFLKEVQPDIICVASLTQLLPREVLNIPRHGVINLHPSMLPKYHGPMPWFWQYRDFVRNIGVTVHALDEGQDTGPIVKQEHITLDLGLDIKEAIGIVAPVGARLMADAVDEIEAGTAVFKAQKSHAYPKARLIGKDEKFVDWGSWTIERVWHFMRGTYIWHDPVKYPRRLKGRLTIGDFERCVCSDRTGEVYRDDEGFFVAHREGKIRLHSRS